MANERKPTVAVDFDGVLHQYVSPWTTPSEITDPPVDGALTWLLEVMSHFRVVIYSARAAKSDGAIAIFSWLQKHGLPKDALTRLEVTAEKPAAVLYIDDRGFCFQGTFPTIDFIKAFKPWNRISSSS